MKGISSILGALIFLQILLVSLLLVIHIQNSETNTTIKTIQKLQQLSEDSPVVEIDQNNVTYIYSMTPQMITHIIYPNEEVQNVSITLGKIPVSKILGNYPWAIIVTSSGNWYNVSYISYFDSNAILFPNYHNYGTPDGGIVENISKDPNWNYLGGVYGPSAYSLVPLNVTVGNTTFTYGVTGAEVVVYPVSSDGWINITYYSPLIWQYYFVTPPGPPSPISPVLWQGYKPSDTASIGVYMPINVSYSGCSVATNLKWINGISYEYIYMYVGTSNSYEVYSINSSHGIYLSKCIEYHVTLGTFTVEHIGNIEIPLWNLFLSYPIYGLNMTIPLAWLPNYVYPDYGLNGTGTLPPTNPPTAISVYQIDINIHKGEWLTYGYLTNKWILLYNYTYDYNKYEGSNTPNEQWHVKIFNLQYLTQYPLYIVVPEGVYLLEVSLS